MKRLMKSLCFTLLTGLYFTTPTFAMGGKPVDASDSTSSLKTNTKYPIVLVPGQVGFDHALGIDYWFGIAKDLRKGGATVFESNLKAAHSIQVRGDELIEYLDLIKTTNKIPYKKFNLITHSFGGQTARYVLWKRPDLVASLTTVAGVHKGTELADNILKVDNIPVVRELFWPFANSAAWLVNVVSGHPNPNNQSAQKSGYDLSTKGAKEFNEKFSVGLPKGQCFDAAVDTNISTYTPEGSDEPIKLYSWMGTGIVTNVLDPDSIVMLITKKLMTGEDHDGFVPRCSAHFGKIIKDNYNHNHADEINHVFGLIARDAADPVTLYRTHVNRLKVEDNL